MTRYSWWVLRFPNIEYLPDPKNAKGVQIELDPKKVGLRFPVDVGLLGNSASVLRELLPQLRRKEDRSFLEKAQKGMDEWRRIMEERANRRDKPMKPQVIAHELGKRLREDAIVSCDSGTIATWWARHIPVKAGQNAQPLWKSRQHGQRTTYVIAAQVAYPRRQCVGFVGDGGFSS